MARLSRLERTAIWQQRINRYLLSDQTVADFCEAEGVSVPSFYQWKRRLSTSQSDPLAQQTTRNQQPQLPADKTVAAAFTELVVTGQQATAKALLPNGVAISLGQDQAIAQAIVDRLLAYEPPNNNSNFSMPRAGDRSASQSSC